MSRFQVTLLLALLITGVVLQALAVYAILFVMRDGYLKAEGNHSMALAGLAAKAVNDSLLGTAVAMERLDAMPPRPGDSSPLLAMPEATATAGEARDRQYLVAQDAKSIVWTNAETEGAPAAFGKALASAAVENVAIVPSAADHAVLLARKLGSAGDAPAGYVLVAMSADKVLSSGRAVLEPDRSATVLLADAGGEILTGDSSGELPADLYARPYSTLTIDGKERLAVSVRIGKRSSPDSFFLVLTREMADVMAPYYSARDGIVAVEVLFLVLIAGASFRWAQHFAAPLESLRHGLELMIGANPEHRIKLSTGDELDTIARYVNRLADVAGATKSELAQEVARATRTIAFEKEKLASILFGLADGVIVCDSELRIVLCNRAAQNILTTTWKPARRGKGLYAYLDAARLKPLADAVADTPRAMKQATFTLANGAIIQAAAVAVGDAEETNYIFLLRDITQAVNVDRQRNRAITETLQNLRGSLSSLLSMMDILVEYDGLDEARRRHFLRLVQEEEEGLKRRLDDMQADATLAPIEWAVEEIDIGILAHQAAEHLRSAAEARLVQVAAVGEAAVVHGDALSLQQLVRRLFEFCIGFADEGGRVEARWGEAEGGWLELKVAYAGRSLSPEEMESIFENPLYIGADDGQAVPSPRQVATMREIIKQHGGEVWAKNTGEGASLSLILPAKTLPLASRVERDSDTVGKQITALLGDGSFYDFHLSAEPPGAVGAEALLRELTFVVMDLETTGLLPREGDEIISIAGIRIEGGEIVKEDYFYSLVNPRRPIPPSSTRVHGISDDMVADQPPIEEVLPKFIEFQADSLLAGHFVSFDLSFLHPKIAAMGLTARTQPALDTLMLSYALFADWDGYNLEEISRNLGVKVVARHTSVGDAYVTAQVLLQLFKVMEGRGMKTLGDALRLQNRDILGKFLRVRLPY